MPKTDWKEVLGMVAPTVATALGGPLAGVAVRALSEKFFGRPDVAEPELEQILAAPNPEVLLQLKQLEIQFKQQMAQAGIELEKIAASDRDSARNREIAVRDHTPTIMGYIVVLLTMLLEAYILIKGPPAGADGVIVGRVLGTMDAAFILVLTYFYGTTASSRRKDDTISDIAKMP